MMPSRLRLSGASSRRVSRAVMRASGRLWCGPDGTVAVGCGPRESPDGPPGVSTAAADSARPRPSSAEEAARDLADDRVYETAVGWCGYDAQAGVLDRGIRRPIRRGSVSP